MNSDYATRDILTHQIWMFESHHVVNGSYSTAQLQGNEGFQVAYK